jgi:hypothetical protein
MKRTRTFSFAATCRECGQDIGDVEWEPDCPPVPCSDHDHPAFSDPGSGGSVDDYPENCPHCGWVVDADWLWEQGSDAAARDSEGAAEDTAERRADERGWDKWRVE